MYRLNELLRSDRKLYHSGDLAILWGIRNKNTLYTTIKRYRQKGILIPVYKGLYSTLPLAQIDPLLLGVAIFHDFVYLSTESVLADSGIIFQAVYSYTFIAGQSRKVTIAGKTYLFRKMKNEYLYNPAGIYQEKGLSRATTERAIADMLYFEGRYHFDNPGKVDWQKVEEIKKEVGYA